MILIFVAQKALSTFLVSGVNIFIFSLVQLKESHQVNLIWRPSNDSKDFLYCYHLYRFTIATPFAVGRQSWQRCLQRAKILQPAVELLVGIPSVVYGFVGCRLSYHVRTVFGGTGLVFLSRNFRSLCHDLPTVTFWRVTRRLLVQVFSRTVVFEWRVPLVRRRERSVTT